MACKEEEDIKPIFTPPPNTTGVVINQEVLAPEHIIIVHGYGEVMATPDYATITLGVQGYADSAEHASALCDESQQSVIDALLQSGVRKSDIVAAGIIITPNVREADDVILGYLATDILTITARDVANAIGVMSLAIDAGASTVHGTTYSLKDAGPAYQAALEAAMDDSLAKATIIANAAGLTLGAVVGVVESPHDESKLIGVDFESSSIAVSASVSVQYLIMD